jgi:hypothetical protein
LDYSERKKYLKDIKIKNEETLAKLQEYSQKLKYEIEVKLSYNFFFNEIILLNVM